jgi:hypothetical protein
MHKVRHPLFFIAARRKSIALSTVGTQNHAHSIGRKFIVRHIVGRIKSHAIRLNGFKGRMARVFPQSNDELRGTWR